MDLTSYNICPRCLGRNFSMDIDAPDNLEESISRALLLISCADCRIHSMCYICSNIFQNINNQLIEYISQEIKIQTSNLTHCDRIRVDKDIIEKEQGNPKKNRSQCGKY